MIKSKYKTDSCFLFPGVWGVRYFLWGLHFCEDLPDFIFIAAVIPLQSQVPIPDIRVDWVKVGGTGHTGVELARR